MAWEVNFRRARGSYNGTLYWARDPLGHKSITRQWHWVWAGNLIKAGVDVPRCNPNNWEIDWLHPKNTGSKVWARNTLGHSSSSREWHWTTTAYLRARGVNTPTYRKDSWEVDWAKREGNLVMARNVSSKIPSAREWHYVDYGAIAKAGLNWKPVEKPEPHRRRIAADGYVIIGRRCMTENDASLAEAHGLLQHNFVKEHRLVALKKYGRLPKGAVVRHINGHKADNAPGNLILGTSEENNMDHRTARLVAMIWREECHRLAAIAGADITAVDALVEKLMTGTMATVYDQQPASSQDFPS